MKYVILDFETTGLDEKTSEIIEIGAILVDGLTPIDRYHTLVKPTQSVPTAIAQLTGITNELLASAPSINEVVRPFADFVGDLPFVAHNSSLEQAFLDHHVSPRLSGLAFTVYNSIDPLAMLLPDHSSHSMESMRKWAQVDSENAHRADKDCEDLLKVLIYAKNFLAEKRPHISTIVEKILGSKDDLGSWWWSWLFHLENQTDQRSVFEILKRPARGDLKELNSKDDSRIIDWKKLESIAPDHISGALKSPGSEQFQYRSSQEEMSQSIRQAMAQGERVAIEAPTGTGKSVAYLVPGVLAAKASETPLIISTHSKSLQDQLLGKDLPLVKKILGREDLQATTVKGQENYLCLRKLHQEMELLPEQTSDAAIEERWCVAYLVALTSVSQVAELDRVSHYLRIRFSALTSAIERVRSHHTTTKGPPCPFYKSCHFFDSARIAHQSDVVIANHSLVFHWPEHLPTIRNVVFDEAHHLEDQITQAYTENASEEELADLLDRLTKKTRTKKVGDAQKVAQLLSSLSLPHQYAEKSASDWINEMSETVRGRLQDISVYVQAALNRRPKGARQNDGYEEFLDLSQNFQGVNELTESIKNLEGAVGRLSDYFLAGVKAATGGPYKTDPSFDALTSYSTSFESIREVLKNSTDSSRQNFLRLLYWNPRENTWRVRISPIDVKAYGEEFFSEMRSVVLTSATLSTGSSNTFVTDRIGLKLSRDFNSLPSPYALDKQAVAMIPADISQPGTPAHLDALIGFTEQVATLLGGRTLLLMTSNQRLKNAAEKLRTKLEKHGISVFDSVTDKRAADNFKAAERAVLVGSERYGEGLDIPGKILSCVVIEKINEAMTRGPLAEARKAKTQFGLYEYDFPLRMMWLKQRVGRLIRSQTDTGAVVIFDPRYHSWSAPSRNHVKLALAPIPIEGGTRDQILMRIESMNL